MSVYEEFKKSWKGIASAVGGFAFAFGLGFSLGNYKLNEDHQIEMIKKDRECDQKVQTERDRYQELKDKMNQEQVQNLKDVVKELKKEGNHGN